MDSNECMNAKLACMRMRQWMSLPVAALVSVLASLTGGATDGGGLGETALSDDLPTSVVMWVCPDEPFAAGIGKLRHYRKTFETKEGLVKATGRWWVDDTGSVFVDGVKMPQSAMMVNEAADLTAFLKKPGRHVISVEGTNLAAAGGVCVSIDLEYAAGRHDSVYTDGSWECKKDDSDWAAVKVYGDLFTAPWTSVADMTKMELHGERIRRAEVVAAREARAKKALAAM